MPTLPAPQPSTPNWHGCSNWPISTPATTRIRGWIIETGDGHLLMDAGYTTIGQQRPSPPPPIDDSPARDGVQPCRPGTKLAKVSAALQNPDGATIFQLMCCTGWQPHTIRGALSGMVSKKLGLNVVSTKAAGGERISRIA